MGVVLYVMISQEDTFYNMFKINAKRIIKTGFVGFWRNGFVSLATVLVMTVTLSVIASIIFINAMLGSSLSQIKDKVDINVYFVVSALEEDILSIKKEVETLPQVSEVEYISREVALERFIDRHENDQLTLQALEELDDNPLGASLSIRAKETSQYEGIANFLQDDGNTLSSLGTPIIESINYFQNKVAIERLSKIIDSAEKFGFAIMIVLIFASIIIIFNTIRLAIYTARDEISVMQLVGATNSYINGPFVFVGIMYGLIAGIVTLVIFYPVTLWLGSATESFFGDINIFTYYTGNFGKLFLIIVGSGIVLGGLSSYLAVKKYLKV